MSISHLNLSISMIIWAAAGLYAKFAALQCSMLLAGAWAHEFAYTRLPHRHSSTTHITSIPAAADAHIP